MKAGLLGPIEEVLAGQRMPTVDEIFRIFPDEAACLRFLFESSGAPEKPCPRCSHLPLWVQVRARVFQCSRCGHGISPAARTPYELTRVDLRLWLVAFLLFSQSPRLLPGTFLAPVLGLSPRAAQVLKNKIWRRMGAVASTGLLGGAGQVVEVDEVLIARHVRRPAQKSRLSVFGITDRTTVRAFVVPDRRRATLFPHILEHVAPGSIIHTDGFLAYRGLDRIGYSHATVNHSLGFYKSLDGATTTLIDAYWGALRRNLLLCNGVSESRLQLFVDAHACRFSYRDRPVEFFRRLMGSMPDAEFMRREASTPLRLPLSLRSQAGRGSYLGDWDVIGSEAAAIRHLAGLALRKFPMCSRCNAVGQRAIIDRGRRLRCSACGAKETIRHNSIFAGSKIPLHLWFRLIKLSMAGHLDISISFAARHLNVSRQAAIQMLAALRRAMAQRQAAYRIGGAGKIVTVGAYAWRVRAARSTPRRTSRTIVIAYEDGNFVCGAIRKNSARYVLLWLKKRVRSGTRIKFPPEKRFAEVASGPWVALPQPAEFADFSPTRGVATTLKARTKLYHHLIDHDRLDLFLKEREFKWLHKEMPFDTILEIIGFPDAQMNTQTAYTKPCTGLPEEDSPLGE